MEQFEEFTGVVGPDFKDELLEFWAKETRQEKSEVLKFFGSTKFDELIARLRFGKCSFRPVPFTGEKSKGGQYCVVYI